MGFSEFIDLLNARNSGDDAAFEKIIDRVDTGNMYTQFRAALVGYYMGGGNIGFGEKRQMLEEKMEQWDEYKLVNACLEL